MSAATPEHLNLRRLPPVDPMLPPPDRYSQTLLRHNDSCQRAAYLYRKHHGGMPGHQLDRGTVVHIAQAKSTMLILEQYAMDAGAGDVDYAVDEHTAKLLLEETFTEHPELTIPLHERDQCRMMMSHLANGYRINPAAVVAVERKFLLQLGDYTVSGIIDLARISGAAGKVDDYKTQWDLPSQGDYDATFQGRLYSVMLVYGQPVVEVPCHCTHGVVLECAACKGRDVYPSDGNGELLPCTTCEKTMPQIVVDCDVCKGRGVIEHLEQPLGGHLETVDVGEVFPRYLSCRECGGTDRTSDGVCEKCGGLMEVPTRSRPIPRIEIDALRRDIEDACAQLHHAFTTGEFPAVSGNHCKRCPCEPECPLPRHLRNYAGTIQTDDQAKEAAEWLDRNGGRLTATKDELKSYCRIHGPLRYGKDKVMEFAEVNRWDTNWKAIDRGARRAAQYGEPFDISEHRRQKLGTAFKSRTLTDAELAAEREDDNAGT